MNETLDTVFTIPIIAVPVGGLDHILVCLLGRFEQIVNAVNNALVMRPPR